MGDGSQERMLSRPIQCSSPQTRPGPLGRHAPAGDRPAFLHWLLITASLSGASGCAAFRPCAAAACADDAQTAASVRAALAGHKEFLPGSIQVLAHAKVVYLYGIAETDLERFHAEAIARST